MHTHTHTHTHSCKSAFSAADAKSNGSATVCLESNTETDLQVTVTALEKTPVDAHTLLSSSPSPILLLSLGFPTGGCPIISILNHVIHVKPTPNFNRILVPQHLHTEMSA